MATLKFTRPIEGKSKVVRLGSRCGVCRCVKMGVPGSECGKVLIFTVIFGSYLYMQPHFQTSHFENYESMCYANMATAIHINPKA